MFGLFSSERTSSTYPTSRDEASDAPAGTYPTSLGGLRYVVMFVDSASRLQRPYGVRKKSAPPFFLS